MRAAHRTSEPSSMRFLVIGCGSIGRRHIRNLRSLGVREIIAFDIRPEQRRQAAAEFETETIDTLDEAWNREPGVAFITAPTSLHVPLALKAATHGCYLFIEKPLSNNKDGLEHLLQLIKQQQLLTMVGCNMRFHPGVAMVKTLLDQDAIGPVIAARVEMGHYLPDWHPWEDYRHSYSARNDLGGGVILDAIHEIDYLRWLLGEVASATCMAGKLSRLEIDTEDTAAILLRFVSGAIGEVHLDYIQRAYSRTCHVIGEEGTIHWDYTQGQVRLYSAHDRKWRVFPNPPDWEPNQMYIDEMKHFFACMANRTKPLFDAFEAARVLEIALAAKQSALHQHWVNLGSHLGTTT
jgi:predicted dehydrogenase